MQFVQVGRFLRLSRITGPSHNLLGLHLSAAKEPGTIELIDLAEGHAGESLSEEEVRRFVTEGVEEANGNLGTNFKIHGIEYLSTDTPPASIYKDLTKRIVERFAGG